MEIFDIIKILDMPPDASALKLTRWYTKLCIISGFVIAVFIGIACYFPDKYEMIIDIVKIVLGGIAIFSLYMSFINHCLARRHKQASIEIEKKNKAIDMVFTWTLGNTAEMLIARKITEHLKTTEVVKLAGGNESLTISLRDYKILQLFLPEKLLFYDNKISEDKLKSYDDKAAENDVGEEKRCKECTFNVLE